MKPAKQLASKSELLGVVDVLYEEGRRPQRPISLRNAKSFL